MTEAQRWTIAMLVGCVVSLFSGAWFGALMTRGDCGCGWRDAECQRKIADAVAALVAAETLDGVTIPNEGPELPVGAWTHAEPKP